MKRIEKEIKELSTKRIESTVPDVPGIEAVSAKKRNPLPFVLIPLAAASLAAAVIVPMAVNGVFSPYQYVQNEELVSFLAGNIVSHQQDALPPLIFNYAMRGDYQMALVQYDFNAKECEGKIAVTLGQKGVDALSFAPKEGKWHTIESEIVNMMGGCIIEYDVQSDLRCVHFNIGDSIPSRIDGRPVIAIYYEGEKTFVEELTQGIKESKKQKEFYSIYASEGNDGNLVEDIPDPYSLQRLYASKDIVDEKGNLTLGKVRERYSRVGQIEEGTLVATPSFFSYPHDVLGLVSPLLDGNKIDYSEFKRLVPEYVAYYHSEAYLGKTELPLLTKTYEINTPQSMKGCYLVKNSEELQGFSESFDIDFESDGYDSSFFQDHLLLMTYYPTWDDGIYYDYAIQSVYIQYGRLYAEIEIQLDKTRLGGPKAAVAEIESARLSKLEEESPTQFVRVIQD